jgi:hypothetical protein
MTATTSNNNLLVNVINTVREEHQVSVGVITN